MTTERERDIIEIKHGVERPQGFLGDVMTALDHHLGDIYKARVELAQQHPGYATSPAGADDIMLTRQEWTRHHPEHGPGWQVFVVPNALYYGDNGRLMCCGCAGATATLTGHDLSGQPIVRLEVDDVRALNACGVHARCECPRGKTQLTNIAGIDGWPLATITMPAAQLSLPL